MDNEVFRDTYHAINERYCPYEKAILTNNCSCSKAQRFCIPEREGAQTLLKRVLKGFSWLKLMWVDGGYSGPAFAQWVRGIRPKLKTEVVKRSDDVSGFEVLPRRWVVERTFGWLMRHRRLVRDYETTESSAQAFAYFAMIRIQLRRLA